MDAVFVTLQLIAMYSLALTAFLFVFFYYAAPASAQDDGAQAPQDSDKQATEVYVWGQQPVSAASEQTLSDKDLQLRPSNTPSDVLRLTPGLIIGQHHGGGKADQILFRGFDSDHGTDFAVFVDGIPVNIPSHAHGQGYADLHWLIPETIQKVEIYKGPYFVQLGDFATSGAMNIVTKQRDKDSSFTAMGGNFNTGRVLGIFSPPEGTLFTPYIAGEVYHSDGPFKNPDDYLRYNLFSKFTLASNAASNLTLLGTFFKTDWNASGEIPATEVRSGRLGRFGSLDPSEGGQSERQNASLIYNYIDGTQSLTAQTWASRYKLRLWSNFTFFLNDQANGDGIEQNDNRWMIGNNINYRRNYTLWDIPSETFVGFQSRYDNARVALYHQKKRHRLSTTSDNDIQQTNLGWFAQQEIRPTDWFRAQLGARLDNFWFNVEQNGTTTNPAISGKGAASIVNPKLNLIFTPFKDNDFAKGTALFYNFGGGYHSNDARVFVQDPKKKIPRYLGGELGFKSRFFDRLDATLSYWYSRLESELVFVGDEATFEPSGPSERQGVESEFRLDILPWLSYDLDLSYTWAKFLNGAFVPLAPRFLAFTGLTARHPWGLEARLQMRYIGNRYGNETGTFVTPSSTILDLILKYVWDRYEFFITFQNLTNAKWRAAEHVFESQVTPTATPRTDAHFTPGDPFNVKAGVTVHLW